MKKIICLSEREFEQFLQSPMEYQEFIKEHVDLMRQDKSGVYHCLLVTGEKHRDGVLVEAEGYDYARYASYVPDATALRYPTLSRLNLELAEAVDAIITEGISRTTEGNWTVTFAELEDMKNQQAQGSFPSM